MIGPNRALHGRRWAAVFAVALALLAVQTALFRFLALKNGYSNDHFLHLVGAQQILFGDWPTKDFLDPGQPLMFGASALAQALFGPVLFAEGILVAAAFALAAVLTALAVRELTGSRALAFVAAVLSVAIVPRAYGYPKLLLYAAAFYLIQRYVTRPAIGRLFALAGMVVVAFLFRHDHGIYTGVGALLTAWLTPVDQPGVTRTRRAVTLVVMIVLLLTPYLVYVQLFGGLWQYMQNGLEFRDSEFTRTWHVWPAPWANQESALLYTYWGLPVVAALLLVAYRRREGAAVMVARVAPLIVVALVATNTFVRRPLDARLPDAIVFGVTLGAWIAACLWRAGPWWIGRPAAVLLVLLFGRLVTGVGATVEELERANMHLPWSRLPGSLAEVSSLLRNPRTDVQSPSGASRELMPFYAYVDRCTTRQHRLLVVGFVPEVLVLAQRGFAGGMALFVANYYEGEQYQRAALQRLGGQLVPFVLIPGRDAAAGFDGEFPLVAAHVRGRYEPLAMLGTNPATSVAVLFDRTIPVTARDSETGWPCLK